MNTKTRSRFKAGSWSNVWVDGRQVEIWEVGDPDGKPTVFLHGWGLTPRSYRRLLHQMGMEGRRVVAPSLPGFGNSERLPYGKMSLNSVTAHIAEALVQIGMDEKSDVVGHSFGGGVALNLGAKHPDLVGTLTLVCPVGGAATGVVPLYRTAMGLVHDAAHRWGPLAAREVTSSLLRNPVAVVQAAHAARTADLTNKLARVSARSDIDVRFLFAEKDTVVSRGNFPELFFDKVTCEIVEGRHSWLLTDTERFMELFNAGFVEVEDEKVLSEEAAQNSRSGFPATAQILHLPVG